MLNKNLGAPFEKMMKITIDVEKEIIAPGGEMHTDSEKFLLEEGSKQEDIWVANSYPLQKENDKRIEFTSLINIRPSADNPGMEISNQEILKKIKCVVNNLIEFEDHEISQKLISS